MGYYSDLSIVDGSIRSRLTKLDKFVCADCVVDSYLAKLVESNLTSHSCDYCGKKNKTEYIAAPYNIIMECIFDTILLYYADAQDTNLSWGEDGWNKLDGDIYIEEIMSQFVNWDEKLFSDLCGSAPADIEWVSHYNNDCVEPNPSQVLSYGWSCFVDQVKTKIRYIFLMSLTDKDTDNDSFIPIPAMLDVLGDLCRRESLIQTISAGTVFYRVRAREGLITFNDMGVPPIGLATAGRMNPVGIPCFYLASDIETAKKEAIDDDKPVSIGQFKLKKDIRIISFVNLPEKPSIFDPKNREKFHNISFLHDFVEDLSIPVSQDEKKDKKEHIDYIPTQIVSEYFRYGFKDSDGENIEGLQYISVKNNTGINTAIFSSDNNELQKLFDFMPIE